jgi:hypothetical protein
MLKFNTFRSDRYLRAKFVEGRYFLASEASDLELELMSALRRIVKTTIGDVAVDDAFAVTRLSQTQLLVKPGDAWFDGLPFRMRSGKDHLVSGASLVLGTVPPGVSITDNTAGTGKILTWVPGSTPTGLYKIVITAQEQIITDVEDPFIKNANLTESTGQKIRLYYKINIVTAANQTETPIPYVNDNGTYNTTNLVNKIVITPAAAQNGELITSTPVSGSSQIDGRDIELTIRNDSGIGGGVKIPNGATDQQAFSNGTLIDSAGNSFHINAIFNVISTQVIVRVDKVVSQPDPYIVNGSPYTLKKRDVFVTDDVTGSPIGKLFWAISNVNWNGTNGFVHESNIEDLRKAIVSEETFEDVVNQKFTLMTTGGGVIGLDIDGATLNWSSNFNIINPSGPEQYIALDEAVLLDGGSLTYKLNLLTGGTISVGKLAVTASNFGASLTLAGSPDLTLVKVGNTIKIGAELAQITAIDNVAKTVAITPSTTLVGSGYIYRDSYASGTAPVDEQVFTLAVRKGSAVVINNVLELSAGSSNAIYDERILYPTGLVASTSITLPVNSRNASKPQYYSATRGNLEVYQNQVLKFQGIDWNASGSDTISFNYNLPNDTEVHFRIDSLPSGSLGGGSGAAGSLQAAYNIGNVITTVGGTPFTVGGAGPKVAQFNGDIGVTGVVDPTGVEFTPQATTPLAALTKGLWVNTLFELIFQRGATSQNITADIENLLTGSAFTSITRTYTNSTGLTIPIGTPVYTPTAGNIAPAHGLSETTARVIGFTKEAINPTASGKVAIAGAIPLAGYTHGAFLYLGDDGGELVDTVPDQPAYPDGFSIVQLGIIEGSNLIIQIVQIGVL